MSIRYTRTHIYKAIQQVVTNIIDTDPPAVENIEYITATKLKRLFVLLSQIVPFTLNLTSLGQQIEAPRQAVLRMCHLLQRAGLLNMLYNQKSSLSQLSKPEKLYMGIQTYFMPCRPMPKSAQLERPFSSIN